MFNFCYQPLLDVGQDGSFWTSDQTANRLYHLTAAGAVIVSLPLTSVLPGANNLRGLAIVPTSAVRWAAIGP